MYANRRGLWAVTNRGIVRLDQGRTLVPVSGTESLRQVGALIADAKGTLWLYDQGRGLFTLRDGGPQPFELPAAHRSEPVTLMYADASDTVWLAFASGQLGLISSGSFRMLDAQSGYVPGGVQAIYQDRDKAPCGLLARTDGLARFADGQFTLLSRQAGSPLSLTAIAEDEERNFWFGSTLGIARVARAEIDKAIAGDSSLPQYTLFDRLDGIAVGRSRSTAGPSGGARRRWPVVVRDRQRHDGDRSEGARDRPAALAGSRRNASSRTTPRVCRRPACGCRRGPRACSSITPSST